MHKIITPLRYSTPAGDKGSFSKRTGSKPTAIINSDTITISPIIFDKVTERILDRLLIRVKLSSRGGKKFTVPDRYYPFSFSITVSGFSANIEYQMQVRLIEVRTVAEKAVALAGQKPKIKKTGSINQFRVKFSTGEDTAAAKRTAEKANSADATKDLLDLPGQYNRIKRPGSLL